MALLSHPVRWIEAWARAVMVAAALLLVLAWALVGSRPANAQTAVTQHDVQFGSPGGTPLKMDVYRPTGTGPFPAVIVVHPGGFVKGDKADPKVVITAQDLAKDDFEAFSINYRVAPAFPYPAPVQDVQTAISFIRQHATQFDVNPIKIAILGGSAGGTLAVSAGDEGTGSLCTGTRVLAVASWSGALDLSRVVQESSRGAQAIEEYVGILGDHRLQLIAPADAPAALTKAAPITYLDKSDPPMFIANSQHEFMPLDQAVEFLDKLKALHIPNAFFSMPAGGHAFDYEANAIQPAIDFLNKYVKDAKCVAAPASSPPTITPHPSGRPSPSALGTGGSTTGDQPTSRRTASSRVIPIAAAAAGTVLLAGAGMWLVSRRRTSPYRR